MVPYVRALESAEQAGKAETYLRDLIAAENPSWHENTLMELLIRQDRFTEAIAAIPDVTARREEGQRLQTTGQQALTFGADHIGDAPWPAPNTAPQE